MPEKTRFAAAVDAEVATHRLNINGALLGGNHSFVFKGRTITLMLPPKAGKEIDEFANCAKYGWMSADPDNPETTWYHVYRVLLHVTLLEPLVTKAEVFTVPNNAYEIVSERQQQSINAILADTKALLFDAFEHWQRVTRWVTRQYALGAPSDGLTGVPVHGARILRLSDGRTFWREGGVIKITGGLKLDRVAWDTVQSVLDQQISAALWFDYLSEYAHRRIRHDYVGALLSLAISCETVMRAILWRQAGQPSNPAAADLIERANAQAILTRWDDLLGLDKVTAKTWPKSKLHELFDLRNKLAHEGRSEGIDRDRLHKLGEAANDFVERANELFCTLCGLENYRVPEMT